MKSLRYSEAKIAEVNGFLEQLTKENRSGLLGLMGGGVLPETKQEWLSACGLSGMDLMIYSGGYWKAKNHLKTGCARWGIYFVLDPKPRGQLPDKRRKTFNPIQEDGKMTGNSRLKNNAAP